MIKVDITIIKVYVSVRLHTTDPEVVRLNPPGTKSGIVSDIGRDFD